MPRFRITLSVLTLLVRLFATLAVVAGTVFLAARVGLSPERALALAGLVGGLLALLGGATASAFYRKIGFRETAAAGFLFLGCAAVFGLWLSDPMLEFRPEIADIVYLASLLGNPLGGVVLGAAAISLLYYLGSALGYMLAGSGRLDLGFGYEAFVAQSHLRLRKRSATRLMTGISIAGVALGVTALTVVLSVMSGFEDDLKQKIVGTNAHAVVQKYGKDFGDWREVMDRIRGIRGVVGASPFVMNQVMLTSDQNVDGAVIKGIDPETIGQVSNLATTIQDGSLEWLAQPEKIVRTKKPSLLEAPEKEPAAEDEPALPGVLIGRELAAALRVSVGSRINIVSPLGGEMGPTGPMPKSRPFKVAAIFFTGMFEYDAKFAYVSLPDAQKFFGMGESVTGIEIKTDDLDNTRQIVKRIDATLEYPFHSSDWGEMNKNLFSALRLEKLVMAIILAFIVLVASFNIGSTLIMMVLEKGKEIAILKSMGSTNTSVMKIFVLEGLAIGLVGTVIGLVLGYATCLFVEVVGIRLDAQVYYIERLPVRIEPLQFATVAGIAILLSFLATIYPATRASRLSPVDGLRNE